MRQLKMTYPEIASVFKKYVQEHSAPGSNLPGSYVRSINKLNIILKTNTNLLGKTEDLWVISDSKRLIEIYEAILDAQKASDGSFFAGTPTPSYWKKRFYSSAVIMLRTFFALNNRQELMLAKAAIATDGVELATELDAVDLPEDQIYWEDDVPMSSKIGKERLAEIKVRENQNVFRRIVLRNYCEKCCLTGLPIVEVLRASHISEWAKDPINRLNPENGLCLSATYDAAFDRHLISFDEDYRLIFSKRLHEYYTNKAFQEQFMRLEGTRIIMPMKFLPSQLLLEKHREIMAKEK